MEVLSEAAGDAGTIGVLGAVGVAGADGGTAGSDGVVMERLEAQICAMAARRAADDCAWLLLIAEFDRREGYLGWECQSTSFWLSWKCGLSMGVARERVRVARSLEHFALVQAEFATGRLSYSKVRAISRVATVHTEQLLVDLGLAATAAQLERICSAYRRVSHRDAPSGLDGLDDLDEQAQADALVERQHLAMWHDDDGLMQVRAAIVADDGALVEAAIASAFEHLTNAACIADVSAATPTRVDALVEIARGYLSSGPVSAKVERRHLLALVDVGVLTRDGELGFDVEGRCTINGRRLTPDTARELGLDAAITTILLDHRGLPLSVGRRSRTATPAQRLALELRDGGHCRFPGCSSRHVEVHHIIPWEIGGLTDLVNLVLLCRFHHRRVHHGGYNVTLDPQSGGVDVTRADGTIVANEPVDLDAALPRPDIADDTMTPGEAGTRLELDDIVEGLAWRDDHGRADHDRENHDRDD